MPKKIISELATGTPKSESYRGKLTEADRDAALTRKDKPSTILKLEEDHGTDWEFGKLGPVVIARHRKCSKSVSSILGIPKLLVKMHGHATGQECPKSEVSKRRRITY